MTPDGIELLKHFEGFRDQAYPDPATGGEPWTIGYGFTKDVKPGDYISAQEAEARLRHEIAEFEMDVRSLISAVTTDYQLSAMVCLAYNIGLGNFRGSTVLRKHNAGELFAAANAFLLWNKAAGHVMAGLVKRREAERCLYANGVWRA